MADLQYRFAVRYSQITSYDVRATESLIPSSTTKWNEMKRRENGAKYMYIKIEELVLEDGCIFFVCICSVDESHKSKNAQHGCVCPLENYFQRMRKNGRVRASKSDAIAKRTQEKSTTHVPNTINRNDIQFLKCRRVNTSTE